jgi:hypothetical protein
LTFASDRTDQALRERVLPGAVRGRKDFVDLHTLHSVAKLLAIHQVTIAEEIGGRGVVRERIHDLLGGPSRGGMLGDVEVNDMPAVVGEHDENEEDAQAGRGHGEEIDRDQVPGVVGEERPPGLRGIGAPLRLTRDTVRSATARPSFRISPWMRGAPQRGFTAAMRVTRALISALTGGRPPVGRPESRVQYSRKRRRCHRRTVAGVTITRGCLHRAQTLASRTQKSRAVRRSGGRLTVLL